MILSACSDRGRRSQSNVDGDLFEQHLNGNSKKRGEKVIQQAAHRKMKHRTRRNEPKDRILENDIGLHRITKLILRFRDIQCGNQRGHHNPE